MMFWSSWRARLTRLVRTVRDSSSASSRRRKSTPTGVSGLCAGALRGGAAVAPRSSRVALRRRAKISFTTSVPEGSSSRSDSSMTSTLAAFAARGFVPAFSLVDGSVASPTSGTERSGVPASSSSSVGSGTTRCERSASRAAARAASSEALIPFSTSSTCWRTEETKEPRVSRAARSWSICRCRALRLTARSFSTVRRASFACSTIARPCSLACSRRASPFTFAESTSRSAARRASWST